MKKPIFTIKTYCCGPIGTNTSLLVCLQTSQAFIIDTPPQSSKPLLKAIQELGVMVKGILLTHSHWDHIAECLPLKTELNTSVFVHALDAPNLRAPGADGLSLPFVIKGLEPTDLLFEGEMLSLGSLSIKVIHTPGHSPGCVCFYLSKEKILFSGDTLFKGCMGRVDLPNSNPAHMWASLQRLSLLPSDTQVFPGHGETTTIGKESWMADAERYFCN